MWKRERTERVDLEDVLTSPSPQPAAPRPAATAPTPTVPATPPAAPITSPAVSTQPAATPHKGSTLGPTLRFKGEIVADEDLLVEGEVEGSILHTRSLTIGANGRMRGDIRARRVVVQGVVDGNLYALESVIVRPGATVNGDVFSHRVSIEEGARMCGRIDMDNAPAVPRINPSGGKTGTSAQDLSDKEVGELLSKS
jgi:cytoskeletal protein CcmA (bactofilin family)